MGLNTSPPKDEDRTYKEFDNVKDIVVRFLRDSPEPGTVTYFCITRYSRRTF